MTIALDTQGIFNSIWGESITYGRVGTTSSTTLTACRYQNGEMEGQTASYGVYSILKETYTVRVADLAFEPKVRDTITPAVAPNAGSARVITTVNATNFLEFYTLECQYPALAGDLDDTATVYRPAPTPDSIGLPTMNLAAVYSNQAVRLQPNNREFEPDIAGRALTTRAFYTCIFGSAVTLNAGDVIEVSSVKYEATGQQEIESLGILTFAACTRITA